jgi:hypothetical protein
VHDHHPLTGAAVACLPSCCVAYSCCSSYLYVMQTAAPWHGAAGDSSGGHKRMLLRRRGLLSTAAGALGEQGAALLEPFVQQYVPDASRGRTLKVSNGGFLWGILVDEGKYCVLVLKCVDTSLHSRP